MIIIPFNFSLYLRCFLPTLINITILFIELSRYEKPLLNVFVHVMINYEQWTDEENIFAYINYSFFFSWLNNVLKLFSCGSWYFQGV